MNIIICFMVTSKLLNPSGYKDLANCCTLRMYFQFASNHPPDNACAKRENLPHKYWQALSESKRLHLVMHSLRRKLSKVITIKRSIQR